MQYTLKLSLSQEKDLEDFSSLGFLRIPGFPTVLVLGNLKKKTRERRQFDQFIGDSSELMHTFGLTEKILFLYVPPYTLAPRFTLSPESLKFGKLDLLS